MTKTAFSSTAREEVATKLDFEEMRKDFFRLETAVDIYAKKADKYF